MKSIAKLILPAALAIGAFGVQAQTIETDYPSGFMTSTSPAPVAAAPAASQAEPWLVQSNFEGVRENPVYAESAPRGRTVAEVRAEAYLAMPASGHNA